MYSFGFTENNKNVCLILHYNGANSYLFVNVTEIIKFKVRNSEIVTNPLCLGNISKRLNGYVYDFSADYNDTAVDHILDIHNYLIKKMI